MELQPLSDHVCIEREEEGESQIGSIVIPDTAKEQPQIGKVLSVGPGKVADDGTRQALTVKPGDRVIYAKFGGTEFDLEGEEFLVLRESDILAVIE
jgi:chaperonin GroES